MMRIVLVLPIHDLMSMSEAPFYQSHFKVYDRIHLIDGSTYHKRYVALVLDCEENLSACFST